MFNDIERKRSEKIIARLFMPRHSPHVKSGGRVQCIVSGQSLTVITERPDLDDAAAMIDVPIAKFRFVRTTGLWQLYWSRADGKWHRYGPMVDSEDLSRLVEEVWADPHYCFWG